MKSIKINIKKTEKRVDLKPYICQVLVSIKVIKVSLYVLRKYCLDGNLEAALTLGIPFTSFKA